MNNSDNNSGAAPSGAFDTKWLPGEPHRTVIMKFLAEGKAHVAERGHGQAPLVVFEDGGTIAMDRVRYRRTARGMQLVSDDNAEAPDQTVHRDVCGSLDELKARIGADASAAQASRKHLARLVRDVIHMLDRLQHRRQAYEAFAAELRSLCDSMDAVARPAANAGRDSAEQLLERVQLATAAVFGERKEEFFATAETVRDAANAQEDCLTEYRKLAVCAGRLYADIKGGRTWEEADPGEGP